MRWALAVGALMVVGCAANAEDGSIASQRQPLLDKPILLDFADQPNEAFGSTLAGPADFDGDGRPDVLIGAPGWGTPLGFPGEGRAYVWSSAAPPDKPTWVADPADEDNAGFGMAVVVAGDVNGDGFDDALIASKANAFLFEGSPSGLSTDPVWLAPASYGSVAAGDFDGDGFSDVVVLTNGQLVGYRGSASGLATSPSSTVQLSGNSGGAITGVGDVNKDGFDDILLGDATANGTAYLYLGSASGLPAQPSWAAPSPGGSSFGYRVVAAGDVNGDGYADFLVGDSFHFYLYLGPRDASSSTLADWGPQSADAVSGAGDVDGDGFGDVVLGNAGQVLLYSGGANGVAGVATPVVDPDNPKGTGGSMGFGNALAPVGDIDGDGHADIAVGIPSYSTTVAGGLGRVYVLASLSVADGGVDSGAGGTTGSGGNGTGAAGVGGKGKDAGVGAGTSGSSGGCGCRAATRTSRFPVGFVALALGLLGWRRRRAANRRARPC